MRLRTTPRLAKKANENCSCPLGYDFRKSKWLGVNLLMYSDDSWKSPVDGDVYPKFFKVDPFFYVVRSSRRDVRRCIERDKGWTYAGKSWIKTERLFRPERFKPHEPI